MLSIKLKTLRGGVKLQIYNDVPKDTKVIVDRIKNAEVITANWIDITKEIIELSPKLRYIIVPSVGYDWIDIKTATQKGIKVINCPTHNSMAVANFVIGLMISITRQISQANNDIKEGNWQPSKFKGVEISGKKLGLVGNGNIGRKIADVAKYMGMEVMMINSKSSQEEVDNILKNSDIISINIPLTDKTKHFIDERRLRLMKINSYLINTSRGAIIDQKALINIIEEDHFAGVALDVFENEPLILNGKLNEEIIKLANMNKVLATPHIAFNSEETWKRLGTEMIENIKAIVNNNPINVVN